jgi:hypothetical protein
MKEDYVKTDINVDEIENSEWLKSRDQAEEKMQEAYNEFYKGVPSAFDTKTLKAKSVAEQLEELPLPELEPGDKISYDVQSTNEVVYGDVSEQDYLIKEKIQALALEAVTLEDDTKLIAYLKEVGLYERAIDVAREYGLNQVGKSIRKTKTISANKFHNLAYMDGDIFLYRGDNKIFNFLIPGYWGHSGFLDEVKRRSDDNYFIYSASNQTDTHDRAPYFDGKLIVGRVGYDKIKGYWDKAVEVNVTRVKNATPAQRRYSIEYAKKFYGAPYNVATSREDDGKFYCSKIVYRGWLSQGYELEPHDDWKYKTEVYWAYKKVAGVKIWYPATRRILVRDQWVTPSDLGGTRHTRTVDTF